MLESQQVQVLFLPWMQQQLILMLLENVLLKIFPMGSLLLANLILSFQKYPFHLCYRNDFLLSVKCGMYDDVLLQNKVPHPPYVNIRGPAIAPSFVTCPTIKIGIAFDFAIFISSIVLSRTCVT